MGGSQARTPATAVQGGEEAPAGIVAAASPQASARGALLDGSLWLSPGSSALGLLTIDPHCGQGQAVGSLSPDRLGCILIELCEAHLLAIGVGRWGS